MTKHASGKYGRLIGSREPRVGRPAAADAWCYMCKTSHRWGMQCTARVEMRLSPQRD